MTRARTKAAARRARKAMARAKGKSEVTLPEAPWQPPQDNTPTPERQAKGSYRVGTGKRVWQDDDATPLRRALRLRKLDLRQVEAGEWMEALQRALSGSPGQRSCLDFSPRGGGETESERVVRLTRLHDDARSALTAEQRAVIRSVCYLHHPIGSHRQTYRRFRLLTEGLNALADMREGRLRKAA